MFPQLYYKKPKRLFAFGCSFTKYFWPSWPEILSYELDIPLYNFGRPGAGNMYIFNLLMQVDNTFHINEDDLVIICWTNVCREDRYFDNKWVTPGNIFTQSVYDKNFVKRFSDPIGYTIRDLALIKASDRLLESSNCKYHYLSMVDLKFANQWDVSNIITDDIIYNQYKKYLDKIHKSFYEVLWNNNLELKFSKNNTLLPSEFKDGHPVPSEHLEYLTKTFDYEFSDNTIKKVHDIDIELYNFLEFKKIKEAYQIRPNEIIRLVTDHCDSAEIFK